MNKLHIQLIFSAITDGKTKWCISNIILYSAMLIVWTFFFHSLHALPLMHVTVIVAAIIAASVTDAMLLLTFLAVIDDAGVSWAASPTSSCSCSSSFSSCSCLPALLLSYVFLLCSSSYVFLLFLQVLSSSYNSKCVTIYTVLSKML